MKKNHYLSKVVSIILTGVIIINSSINVLANGEKPKSTDFPVQITYIGEKNLLPVFEIQIDNLEADDYIIFVKDANGVLLYSEKLTTKKIIRKYVLEADDLEMMGTTFEVTNKKTNETSAYKISRQVKEENIIVYRAYTAW
jgi:hypothetical protein